MSLRTDEALRGYTIHVGDLPDLSCLASRGEANLTASAPDVQPEAIAGERPDAGRVEGSWKWMLVASGYWSQDEYHSGHIAYYIASPVSGCWVLEARERNAILDDVTDADIEEGRLNDDQLQALWGQTLEEAQNAEDCRIVAWAEGVDCVYTAKDLAAVLYRAVCEEGGNEITEPDGRGGGGWMSDGCTGSARTCKIGPIDVSLV